MRFPVHRILDLLAAGHAPTQILKEYPYLEPEDITEAIEGRGRLRGGKKSYHAKEYKPKQGRDILWMMIRWGSRHRDFLARSLMDFAKAMFAVGLASYFFKEFPVALRVGCAVSLVALFVGSLALYPTKKPEE